MDDNRTQQANTGKAARPVPPGLEEGGAPEKKKRISGKAVAAILIIVLIAAVGVCYYFNLLGLKTKVVDFFKNQDPAYQSAITEYNAKKTEYEQKLGELDEKEQSLNKKEQELSEQEASLTQKGTMATTGSGTTKNAAAAAAVFEQMDKNAAAEILNNTNGSSWIAEVLSAIDEKKAADILGAMDPAKASAVAQFMS